MVGTIFKLDPGGYTYLIKSYNPYEGYNIYNISQQSLTGYYSEIVVKRWLNRKTTIIRGIKIHELW